MNFLSPAYLLLLLVVALLAGAYVVIQLRRKTYVARFSNLQLLGTVAPRRPGWRRHLTFALLLAGLTVLSIGTAKPSAAVRVPRERATVILAIDVSLSMEATDVLPSRIAAARTAAKEFADLLPPRINLGVVSFSGSASLLVSPTQNRTTVKNAISSLQPDKSTAIGEAIFTSLQAIQVFNQSTTASGDTPAPARIVLMSDGSNTVGRWPIPDPDHPGPYASDAAKKAHVDVSTIAFGTQTGTVTINGVTQTVPADDYTLGQIASLTGGSFHTAHTEQELSSVYKDIGSQIGYTTERRDISYRFLVAGLLVLFAAGGSAMLWSGRLV